MGNGMLLEDRIVKFQKDLPNMFTDTEKIVELSKLVKTGEGTKQSIDDILKANKRLESEFLEIFHEFYQNVDNKVKLDEYADIISSIVRRNKLSPFYQKIIFSLYISNSIEELDKIMMSMIKFCDFDFRQMMGEYVDWEKFKEIFGRDITLQSFIEDQGKRFIYTLGLVEGVDYDDEEGNNVFLALKNKFRLGNR